MRIADEIERRWGRKAAWAASIDDVRVAFTSLSIPVMTRLRQADRIVLDTLVEAGVARSRSEALAWCVRLVGRNEAAWIAQLRDAMEAVERVRAEGPAATPADPSPPAGSTGPAGRDLWTPGVRCRSAPGRPSRRSVAAAPGGSLPWPTASSSSSARRRASSSSRAKGPGPTGRSAGRSARSGRSTTPRTTPPRARSSPPGATRGSDRPSGARATSARRGRTRPSG